LISNPGAESGTSSWSTTIGEDSTGKLEIVSENAYSGSKCFKVTKTNTTRWHYFQQNLQLKKGSSYLASIYCKTNNVSIGSETTSGARIVVQFRKSDNTLDWSSAILKNTNNWKKINTQFTLSSSSTDTLVSIFIGIKGATGTAYFDNVTIQEIIS